MLEIRRTVGRLSAQLWAAAAISATVFLLRSLIWRGQIQAATAACCGLLAALLVSGFRPSKLFFSSILGWPEGEAASTHDRRANRYVWYWIFLVVGGVVAWSMLILFRP
jgi:hypothetical protein